MRGEILIFADARMTRDEFGLGKVAPFADLSQGQVDELIVCVEGWQ